MFTKMLFKILLKLLLRITEHRRILFIHRYYANASANKSIACIFIS
jgi:hypothetical protein